MQPVVSFRVFSFVRLIFLAAAVGVFLSLNAIAQNNTNLNLLSIAELRNRVVGVSPKVLACRLEGVVRAVAPEDGLVALQDASGTVLLRLPRDNPAVVAGQRIVVEANPAAFLQSRFGISMDDIPVVDNGGLHSVKEVPGSIFLKTGKNPIRVDWFNGPTEFALNLDYEGPGIARQKIPDSILWHAFGGGKAGRDLLRAGLRFKAYEGVNWRELPDFSTLIPTAEGVATNFSASYRTRDESCGLSFEGFIQINHPGTYTFHLKSDDGSKLYVGEPSVLSKVIGATVSNLPAPETLEQALTDRTKNHWVQMEGKVVFAGERQQSLDLEMLVGGNRVPVTIVEGSGLFATNLLHSWIRVQGVCEFLRNADDHRLVGIFVPGVEQVKVHTIADDHRDDSHGVLLTTAAQVRRLKTTEAEKHIPVKIRGVVIYASSTSAVIQDSSGGIFMSFRDGIWNKQPNVGETWEMQGSTDSGLFSPVMTADSAKFYGYAALPEPIQPTRDQLMNGNMDAEYGELHGVITSISSNEISLLTADGKVSVVGNDDRPLPKLPETISKADSQIGSVVRIRGCFAPMVDTQTRQVISGKTYIYPALVEVEDPAPQNPFQLLPRTPSDLMWFNARAVALQRTKLTGQILHSMPGEYFVQNGKTGFRVLTKDASLKAGDLMEAVGFPKLDSPSPILQEAQVRKTGHAPLPTPVQVSPEALLDRELDATWVKVEAQLISDTVHQGERVLELQSGPRHFVARLDLAAEASALLPAGCRLQLTGVYVSAYGEQEHAGAGIAPFEMRLNRSSDMVVLQRPPWWTLQRVVAVAVALSAVLAVTFIWVALLRRKVEQRTAQLRKEIEQRQLVEQHHAIEMERTRVARDLHDELGAGLTEVGLLGSLANTPAVAPEEKGRYLNQLTQMARSLVTSLDEIVWAVNPHYDSLPSLVSYFSLHAESVLHLAGITCRLRVAENIPQHPLDSKQRHGIFCAFKEALNNVIRHSGATEAQIVFDVTEEKLVLSVIDNGCGFEFVPESPGKDGLTNLRQRMHELGGMCQVTSQSGHGTTVQIFLPLSQNQNGQGSNR